MIKMIIKNVRYKLLIMFTTLIITFITLIKVEHFESLNSIRLLLGGYKLGRMFLITAFIMCIALIQYINIDAIAFLLKNNTYFIIRYKNKNKLFYTLLKSILLLNIIFMGLLIIAFVLSSLVCGVSFMEISFLELLELIFRGLITCICFILMQIYLFIKFDEINTFMIMTIISVICVFLTRINIWIFTIFPVPLPRDKLYLNIIICLIYIGVGILECNKLYKRKDV